MNEGWICPRCGKVNAPDVKSCNCHTNIDLKKKNKLLEELKKCRYNENDVPASSIYKTIGGAKPFWDDWYIIC